MASRKFKCTWVGVYREDTDKYVNANIVRTGGGTGYNSYIGFNGAQILGAIESSKTTPKVILHFNVTDTGTFDLGMHRETNNRKANGLPFYRYTGRSFNPSKGWASYDITKFNIALSGYSGVDTFEEALGAGFQGIVLYGARGANGGVAHGYTNNSNHLYIEVQGTWNTKPGKPGITYPKSGNSVDGKIELKGTAASDAEQSAGSLRYQWRIYDGTWHNLSLGSAGIVNKTVDFSGYKETSAAKVGLRAYDGEFYSDWVNSQVFTINHNKPPSEPSNLNPKGGTLIDRTQDILFSWAHNDQDRQSRFIFRWRVKGELEWKTVDRKTVNNFYIVPANTFPVGEIEWQVQTFDQRGLSSPFSTSAIFYATEATNAPTIIYPEAGELISDPSPSFQWTSIDQDFFQLEVLSGENIIWQIESNSDVKGFTIGTELSNETDYTARLRVKTEFGLWSDWAILDFTTSFLPPQEPEINLVIHPEDGAIEIGIFNPPPEDDVPEVSHNEIFRKVYNGSGDFIKIKNYVENSSYWIDYTPGSGVTYEYMVRSWGVNGTYVDSPPLLGMVEFKDSLITVVSNPDYKVELKYNPTRSIQKSVKRTLMEFNGRPYPVAEFGTGMNNNIDLSFHIRDQTELNLLDGLLELKETLLYRDSRGRREFVTMDQLSISDKFPRGYTVNMTFNRVDYREGE